MGRVAAQPVGQTANAVSGLPRRGEQSESIPPSPPYFKKSSYESTGFFFAYCTPLGDENPRPGFDTKLPGAILNSACAGPVGARPRDGPSSGAASWTDRERSEWAAPQGQGSARGRCAAGGQTGSAANRRPLRGKRNINATDGSPLASF